MSIIFSCTRHGILIYNIRLNFLYQELVAQRPIDLCVGVPTYADKIRNFFSYWRYDSNYIMILGYSVICPACHWHFLQC